MNLYILFYCTPHTAEGRVWSAYLKFEWQFFHLHAQESVAKWQIFLQCARSNIHLSTKIVGGNYKNVFNNNSWKQAVGVELQHLFHTKYDSNIPIEVVTNYQDICTDFDRLHSPFSLTSQKQCGRKCSIVWCNMSLIYFIVTNRLACFHIAYDLWNEKNLEEFWWHSIMFAK